MLTVIPIQEKEEQARICAACGVPFRADAFGYQALEGDALHAVAQFDIFGKNAVIYGMSQLVGAADDLEAMFILGRGVLNFLDLCAVETATYETQTEHDEKLARICGFRKGEDGVYRITLTGLFHEPCQHGQAYPDTKQS